jgi:hypothetical protein
MKLASKAPESTLDLGIARPAADAEQLVVVTIGGGHSHGM